jgi:hypothetical protein
MNTDVQEVNFHDDIAILPIAKWLNYAAGCDASVFVALPLIQRGSVWKPKQIIDLWDTLLRGMPLGSLIYSPMGAGINVRKIGENNMIPTPESGTIGLIDGQQRTLAMLIAWSEAGKNMDRRIWVDFADKAGDEHLFRLHVTTKNQPFGFQKASPNTKLALADRRDARTAFIQTHSIEKPTREELFEKAKPYDSKSPLDLRELIELWREHEGDKVVWGKQIEGKLEQHDGDESSTITPEQVKVRIGKFADALQRLFKLKIPLIKIDSGTFSSDETDRSDLNNETIDPPLAVLFKRIGTGGTPLSDADYVYSVIKHRIPETYALVEELHGGHNIASLLSATDLVMTAVRLAAAENEKPLTDWESPTKQNFHSLIKHDIDGDGFLNDRFLPLIKKGTQDTLNDAFISLTALLTYHKEDNKHGLPPYAFPLLNRPLVQVLVRWIRCVQQNKPNDLNVVLRQSREEVLRFVMYWQLCVTDPRKASLVAYKQLPSADTAFPGKEIYRALLEARVAISILAPETIKRTKPDVVCSSGSSALRGWKRFNIEQTTDDMKRVVYLYQRWWGNNSNRYEHHLLLWLQRETVAEFEGSPVAGREEDTPYDYDHICPANHWGNWTGATGEDRLIDFLAKDGDGAGHRYVGNSIGNIRVWDSSKNRGDGKDAPSKKLAFNIPIERDELLKQSAIGPSQIEGWESCSEGERSWNKDRVKAFQQVVEQRAFALYESFYKDLDFSVWPEKFLESTE